MASSAGAAHMVHLCNIWASPWEQCEICQCQSQTLCAHPSIPTSGVRKITITMMLRSSIWSRTKVAPEDEKRIKNKLFPFQRYWGQLQTWVKIPVCRPGGVRDSFKPRCCMALHRNKRLFAFKELRRTWLVEAFRLERKTKRRIS